MQYTQSTFSVGAPGSAEYRRNYDRIVWAQAKPPKRPATPKRRPSRKAKR